MKHVYALLIKFIMITIITAVILGGLANVGFLDVLYISLAITILAYVIGDLFILSATNNLVATIADALLALAVIYLCDYLWIVNEISFANAIITALVIGAGEWFFHKYVANNVFPAAPTE